MKTLTNALTAAQRASSKQLVVKVTYKETSLTTTIFYSNAHPESTSVDGVVEHYTYFGAGLGLAWAALVAAAGTDSDDATWDAACVRFISNVDANKWARLSRGIALFDTSGLLGDDVISSATLSLYGLSKKDDDGWLPSINIYSAAPASNTALVAGDFDSLGTTPFCDTPITYANWSITGYNDFVLNAAGLAAISKGGITKFGVRNANYDVAGTPPTWTATERSAELWWHQAEVEIAYNPKLTITYYKQHDISADVIEISQEEGPYSGAARVILDNRDRKYNSFTYKGQPSKIWWGYMTAKGKEYGLPTPNFIEGYAYQTGPGVSRFILDCGNDWTRLFRWKAYNTSPPAGSGDRGYYFNFTTQTSTIKDIISWICTQASVTLGTSISEDALVDTLKPIMWYIPENQDGRTAVLRLLLLTDCELLATSDTNGDACMKLIYPQTSDASVYTYGNDAGIHPVGGEYRRSGLSPINQVNVVGWATRIDKTNIAGTFVVGETVTGGTSAAQAIIVTVAAGYLDVILLTVASFTIGETITSTGGATATVTSTLYGVETSGVADLAAEQANPGLALYTHILEALDSQHSDAQCASIATAMLNRFQRTVNRGQAVVPMNCGQEVHDVITIKNPWTGQTISDARVGRIIRTYKQGKYDMSVYFGTEDLLAARSVA